MKYSQKCGMSKKHIPGEFLQEKVRQFQQTHHLDHDYKKLYYSHSSRKAIATYQLHFQGQKHFPFQWTQT